MEVVSGLHISAHPTQGEIEWSEYVQELERQKQEPQPYAAHFSDGTFDPAALPILGRFERRNIEAQTVTQENVLLPRDELPAAKPRAMAPNAPKSDISEYMAHMLDPPPDYDVSTDYESHYNPVTHTYPAPMSEQAPHRVVLERVMREAGGSMRPGRRLVQGHGPTAGVTDTLGQARGDEYGLEAREAPQWDPIKQQYFNREREMASLEQMTMEKVAQHQRAIEERLRLQPYDPVKWIPFDVVHGLSPPGQSPHENHNQPSRVAKENMQDSSHVRQVLHFSPVKVPQRPPDRTLDGVPVAQRDHVQRLIRQVDLEGQIQASMAQREERVALSTPIQRAQVSYLLDAETALKFPQQPSRPDRRRVEGPVDAEGGVPGIINGVKKSNRLPPHRTFKISHMFPLYSMPQPEPEESLGYIGKLNSYY